VVEDETESRADEEAVSAKEDDDDDDDASEDFSVDSLAGSAPRISSAKTALEGKSP